MAIGDKKPVVMQSDRAVPSGIATLGTDGTIPVEQLPMLRGTRYVFVDGENGSDTTGDGTEAKPFQTIQKAVDSIPKNLNGDAAYIMVKGDSGTTYEENVRIAGFYGGPIMLRAYDISDVNNVSTIRGSLLFTMSDSIVLETLNVEGTISCSYTAIIQLGNCKIHSAGKHALRAIYCPNLFMRGGQLESLVAGNGEGAFTAEYSFCSLCQVEITEATAGGIASNYGSVVFVTECDNKATIQKTTYKGKIYE